MRLPYSVKCATIPCHSKLMLEWVVEFHNTESSPSGSSRWRNMSFATKTKRTAWDLLKWLVKSNALSNFSIGKLLSRKFGLRSSERPRFSGIWSGLFSTWFWRGQKQNPGSLVLPWIERGTFSYFHARAHKSKNQSKFKASYPAPN